MVCRGHNQRIQWAVEAKWSDRFVQDAAKLKNSLRFCRSNGLQNMLVTSKKAKALKWMGDVKVEFVPASEYCYTVGYNLVMGKQVPRGEEHPA